jgi:uncharacterized protein YutE (UPF0331/DUF86 family)
LVDRETFDRRLGRLEELLRGLRSLAELEKAAFLADQSARVKAERWLQLAGEVAIDLANQLIADRGWPTPHTYRESFQILAREGVLAQQLAAQMEGWAALRNLLVHLYMEIDYERLFEILKTELDQLDRFAQSVGLQLD